MSAPYEIVASPFTLWLAPVATAFPAVEVAPGAAWVKIGTSGGDGVTVTPAPTVETWRVGPTNEELRIRLTLAGITPEEYAAVLGDANQRALLVRGAGSSFAAGLSIQYEVPVAVQVSEPEGGPAGLLLKFTVLEDAGAAFVEERFGRLVAQHQ